MFSNSNLVTYKNITSNKSIDRKHSIDTITIHCYVGQVTAKQGCDYFAKTNRQVSANYVVGYDGSIGLSVDEKDRAWTSSSESNDRRAITIEVACDNVFPYAVTDKAYNSLITLVADVCKRNSIKELKWKNNKDLIGNIEKQNMTVHRWFKATECPGEYIMQHMSDIANKVNSLISTNTDANNKNNDTGNLYKVQVGAFSKKENAENIVSQLKENGYKPFIVNSGSFYKVQVGAFSNKSNADNLSKLLKSDGFDCYIYKV